MKLPRKLQNAIEQLKKLPGIGEKTAIRHALMLANWSDIQVRNFTNAIISLQDLVMCEVCGLYTDNDQSICEICLSPSRAENKILCIVENSLDALAIEKSKHFQGRYHVLGGVLNPLLNIGPEELNIKKILERIKSEAVHEIILALNPSVEGDLTSSYIREIIPSEIKVERIGLGIPVGGSIEFLDSMTLSRALENRRAF